MAQPAARTSSGLSIWAARRPVRILALGAHGLGFDLLVLAVVRSAPLGGLSRIVVGALGLLLIVGTAIGGVALSALAGQVRPGGWVLLVSAGAGYTAGAALLKIAGNPR